MPGPGAESGPASPALPAPRRAQRMHSLWVGGAQIPRYFRPTEIATTRKAQRTACERAQTAFAQATATCERPAEPGPGNGPMLVSFITLLRRVPALRRFGAFALGLVLAC